MTDLPEISRRALLAAGVAAAAALAGCTPKKTGQAAPTTTGPTGPATPPTASSSAPTSPPATTGSAAGTSSATTDPTAGKPPVDPASVKANELGMVPVMMYHRITPKVLGEFDTTPADFKAQLQRMFAAGYRPVRTIDLVRGDLRVAAGYTPAVFTFDDGYPDQFAMSGSGEIDPQSAVGIMLAVCKEFPDCAPAGSFNINNNPFGLSDLASQHAGLTKLHELGFEIANHTFHHDNLGQLDPAATQKDFVQLQKLVEAAVPGATVRTMALPFGVHPHVKSLAHTGSWQGETYVNEGVLEVGANPSHSPYSIRFDPLSIPRIRGTSWQGGNVPLTAKYWLDYFDHNKSQRYVSAGNPGHVTIPKSMRQYVIKSYADKVITY
jgi:peptidoglycan/xylan/chitin deacetylase (PgdA/CDA1 family)